MWFFYCFYFERNYDVLKSKRSCLSLKKNINLETESKKENPKHSFREINHVLQLVQKLRIKSKVVTSWSSRKKSASFVIFTLSEGNHYHLRYLNALRIE